MQASDAAGWLGRLPPTADAELTLVRRLDSPFFNARPEGVPIRLLVVHGISLPEGEFGGPHVASLFLGRLDINAHPSFEGLRGVEVSAHFLIDRLGVCTQFVSIFDRAWHAGQSSFLGQTNCNDFSVGVELEGCDDQAYAPVQIDRLVQLCRCLSEASPSLRAVTGHSDIAPGRKTDPGPLFDWAGLQEKLAREAPEMQLFRGETPNYRVS